MSLAWWELLGSLKPQPPQKQKFQISVYLVERREAAPSSRFFFRNKFRDVHFPRKLSPPDLDLEPQPKSEFRIRNSHLSLVADIRIGPKIRKQSYML
jgi:hypothetical protein